MKDFNEKFIERNIATLAQEYDKIKGANTNLARITPDFIDGLKPVHRRALYIMYSKDRGKKFRKLATISGDVFGRVHPHSPKSIEDALVGLTQMWHNNIPLIEGEGNFGSVSGDPAGASRYIKARLSEYANVCFFDDWKESVVDMVMGYDEETKEPLYLPARYPNVLLNGSLGIGYGMSSNIPPFNFKEVVNACIKLMADPDSNIILIPDSPSGSDVIDGDFGTISNTGNGVYSMRCKYEIVPDDNTIVITNLPYQISVNTIRERIADIKEKNGLAELVNMSDYSGKVVDLRLTIRDDVNPYKFMAKLIKEVSGLEKSYPVNITVTNDYQSFDYSVRELLLEWIRYRREQKRVVVNHKRTTLLSEQRTNDVRIFLMDKSNLHDTIKIFTTSRDKSEIEARLIATYKHSSINMDTLQAKTLSDMKMHELSISSYEKCIKRRDELFVEIANVDKILNGGGIDDIIISELRDGIKRFGLPRRSNVVPRKLSTSTDIDGSCILQLDANGTICRTPATNVDDDPIPNDSNGFAVIVDNDSSFILVDDKGKYSFIKVNDLPIDQDVPVNRYLKQSLGNIIGLLPWDIDTTKCCILISRKGNIKKLNISEMSANKKTCMSVDSDDAIIRAIVCKQKSTRDLLIYTELGMGQRLDPNMLRITSVSAKGVNGFNLAKDDLITGCYLINPDENQYIFYMSVRGRGRLNEIKYLPKRNTKHDSMVKLISLGVRDRLLSVSGCNKLDKFQLWRSDGESDVVDINTIPVSTMSSPAEKVTTLELIGLKVVKMKRL